MSDSESKALWKIVSELKGQGKAHQYFLETYHDRFEKLEDFNKNLITRLSKDRENHHKWQRDVEEKCSRVMDKNKELQIEVDALKQMIWTIREKRHELPSRVPE